MTKRSWGKIIIYKEVLGLDPKSEKKALISVGVSYFIYFNQVAFESIIRFKM